MSFEHHFVTLLCAFWRDPYVMSCHKYYCNKTSFAQAKAGSSDRISLLSSVRILFFWKLVSHGGLDFSIFVSSTIWNQCFRSKNCSTAKGHLQRSCCPGTSSPLLPTELVQEKKNLRRKVYSWTCWVGKGGQCRDGAVFSRNSEAWAEPGFVMVFLWTGSSSHQQEPVGGAFQCVTGQHWVGYVIAVGRTLSSHQHCPPAPTRHGTFSCSCWVGEIRLATCTIKVWTPLSTTGPISYTGWPISPGVQSLFLSSTIWNRLWCRGKSSSLKVSCQVWSAAACGFLEDGWAERGGGRLHLFLLTSLTTSTILYAQVIDHLVDF